MDIFLSYNFRDNEAVNAVAQALQQQGLSVFLDRWYLTPGISWQQELERALSDCRAVAVFIGPSGLGRWQQQEKKLALDRQARDPAFPVIPVLLPGADPPLGFLSLNTWIDLRAGLTDPFAYKIFTAAVRMNAYEPRMQELAAATLATVCPFRGLRPFREEDATFFFGREPYIPTLLEVVTKNSFVAVVGASGSGKSSVVSAGLVPQVRRGACGQAWDVVTVVPGDRPLHALADAMLSLIEHEKSGVDRLATVNKLAGHLLNGDIILSDVVAEALKKQPGTERFLLVVDQWEELYTGIENETTRRRFIDQLLSATKRSQLSVVLTLRGDFFGHVLSYRPLSDRLQHSVINLGPMNREELKRTIVEPAKCTGMSFEPGLVERVLNDIEDEPGNLPLLEFALTELWARRRDGSLSNDAYDSIGGVAGAIAQRAEGEYAKFTPEAQVITQYIFKRLVRVAQPTEGIDDARRRVILDELWSHQRSKDGHEVKEVVKALADARLLVTSRDAATGKVTVEVAHEALIRKWKRLRDWIDQDRYGLSILNRLTSTAEEWRVNQRKRSFLYQGAHLTEALDWARANGDKLSDDESLFLAESNMHRRLMRAGVVVAACAIALTAVVAIFFAIRERELKFQIMRDSDELKLQSLVEELRAVWLDELGMQEWLRGAAKFAEPVDRHTGFNPHLDQRLRQFKYGETGDMAMARQCFERLRALKSKTIDEQKAVWEEVIRDIADPASAYGGLRLREIEGLIPLRKDPKTGLHEFAVYLTGEAPVRGVDGNLVVNNESALVLVLVPAGSFKMGAVNREEIELPAREEVRLDAYLFSKYEMTQGQWIRATYRNPSQNKTPSPGSTTLMMPVESISWKTAAQVLDHLHLTLPTEAQWEYAARAKTSGDWFAGDREAAMKAGCIAQRRLAGDLPQPRPIPCDVTYGMANNFGLFGTIGNVWEWCLDPVCPYEVTPKTGTGERKCDHLQRVYRGGSFFSEPDNARATLRRSSPPQVELYVVGVRPVMRLDGWTVSHN
jgi:formylglycine-generating enzyme required for sulfatase activity/energy-coupling factor transporter ATP-binding protein EcfA2